MWKLNLDLFLFGLCWEIVFFEILTGLGTFIGGVKLEIFKAN